MYAKESLVKRSNVQSDENTARQYIDVELMRCPRREN